MEYYAVLRKKEILAHIIARMYLGDIILSEESLSQICKGCMIPLIRVPRIVRFIETNSRNMVVGGWREWGMGVVQWVQSFNVAR